MESKCFQEHKSLVNEITKGMEQVKQLRATSSSNQETLLERMLASYNEALLILTGSAPEAACQSVISSSSGPPGSEESTRGSRKRKSFSSFAEQVTVTLDTLPKVPDDEVPNDGYIWKEYGQKKIKGSNYPRSYFRCIHRHDKGCLATKHVQRLDNDPFTLNITYRGKHTCLRVELVVPQVASSEKKE